MAEGDLSSQLSNPEFPEPGKKPVAWNPLTPAGIAAFAFTSLQRLFLIECLVALTATGTLLWFLLVACLPTLRAAALKLPDQGRIEGGLMSTPVTAPTLLAETRILALVMDPSNEGGAGVPSDFRVKLHTREMEICSLLGCLELRYPRDWIVELNRKDLGPRLEAWTPMVCTLIGAANCLLLLLVWAVLASLYAPVAWLIGLYQDRQLSVAGSWRLAAAALMPGALLMAAGQVLYGLGLVDLIRVSILFGLHFPVGWVFLVLATLRLPRASDAPPKAPNPFVPPSAGTPPENPFAPPS